MSATTSSNVFTVALQSNRSPENLQFSADSDKTILQSAEKSQIHPQSSCRNGSCRTCISTLINGDIRYSTAWPGLSAEEKQAGLILPCSAYPQNDLVIKLGA